MKTPKEHIPLPQTQREIIKEFYTHVPTKVILNKTQRNDLWKVAIKRSKEINFTKLKKECPALEYQILQSYKEKARYEISYRALASVFRKTCG